MRTAMVGDVDIVLDCPWWYHLPDALKIDRALEPFSVAWLEDPLPPESVDGFRILREGTTVPICTGENLYLREGFKPCWSNTPSISFLRTFKKRGDCWKPNGSPT